MAKATTAWTKLTRTNFAKRLNENIKKNSRLLTYMGGNVTMAPVNYDFAYELIEIFNETIVEMLLDGQTVNFDQFGKYEIITQYNRRVKTFLTGGKEIILPELKILRFYPASRMKQRLRGEVEGRVQRNFHFESKPGVQNIVEGENTEDGSSQR